MVDREFSFNEKILQEFPELSKSYRYSVGQPMGCLSS
jgi:hypothetical protein